MPFVTTVVRPALPAVSIDCGTGSVVRNYGADSVYYDESKTVSASDGELATGASVTLSGQQWLMVADDSDEAVVTVLPVAEAAEQDAPTFSGAVVIEDTLGVAGAVTMTKATGTGLAVTANETVGGTLVVTGASTLTGAVGATKASGTGLAVTANATVGGTLGVTGVTTTGGLSLTDATDVVIGTSTGTKIGQSGSKVSFFGVAPVARPAAYTQTYSTAARTVPDATVAAVATDAAGLAAYGYTEAQANAVPVAINALAADVLALKKVLTAVIDDLQSLGLAQ